MGIMKLLPNAEGNDSLYCFSDIYMFHPLQTCGVLPPIKQQGIVDRFELWLFFLRGGTLPLHTSCRSLHFGVKKMDFLLAALEVAKEQFFFGGCRVV